VQYPEYPGVRAQAIEAAEEVMGKDALLLIRGAMKDEQPVVRFAACMALGRLKDSDAAPALRELLNDSDPNVRAGVYFALERLGDSSHRAEWVDLLRRHENPIVRRNAVMAMGMLGDAKVLPLLELAANSDPDEGVKLQAFEGMARLGNSEAIGRFLQYAIAGQSFRQPYALVTLAHVKDDRVAPALRTRLESSPYLESRLAAARSLGAIGYPNGFELALASLEWSEPQPNLPDDPPESQLMRVRSMAAMALGEIGDRRALDALARRMQTPDDPRVQLAAATAVLMILSGPAS
jgi:HEAT repeat protein